MGIRSALLLLLWPDYYRSRFATNPFGFGGERAEYRYHDYRDSKLRVYVVLVLVHIQFAVYAV